VPSPVCVNPVHRASGEGTTMMEAIPHDGDSDDPSPMRCPSTTEGPQPQTAAERADRGGDECQRGTADSGAQTDASGETLVVTKKSSSSKRIFMTTVVARSMGVQTDLCGGAEGMAHQNVTHPVCPPPFSDHRFYLLPNNQHRHQIRYLAQSGKSLDVPPEVVSSVVMPMSLPAESSGLEMFDPCDGSRTAREYRHVQSVIDAGVMGPRPPTSLLEAEELALRRMKDSRWPPAPPSPRSRPQSARRPQHSARPPPVEQPPLDVEKTAQGLLSLVRQHRPPQKVHVERKHSSHTQFHMALPPPPM